MTLIRRWVEGVGWGGGLKSVKSVTYYSNGTLDVILIMSVFYKGKLETKVFSSLAKIEKLYFETELICSVRDTNFDSKYRLLNMLKSHPTTNVFVSFFQITIFTSRSSLSVTHKHTHTLSRTRTQTLSFSFSLTHFLDKLS